MPGQSVRIGPFVGGLNNVSTAGESKDDEVVELVNYELALDTSLISRPPIENASPINAFAGINWMIHGIYRITASDWYVIASQPSTSAEQWFLGAWAKGDFSTPRISIKTITGSANQITGFAQYNDWCYFSVGNTASIAGFRWNSSNAAADITTMPKGTCMVSWKDRLWITGSQTGSTGNYVWFSTVDSGGPKPNTWNVSVDFFNVDPGSGGLNTALLPLTSSILIFKEDATYRFAFPNSPKNGEVVNLSRQIGAAGPTAVVGFENYAFVYDQGRIYELINTKFTQINLGVALDKNSGINVDATAPGVDISIIGRRLVIRYYTNVYVYSVDTRTWSQWQSFGGTPGKFYELPGDSSSASPAVFMAAFMGITQLPGDNRIYDPLFLDDVLNAQRAGQDDSNGKITIANGAATMLNLRTTPNAISMSMNDKGEFLTYDIPVGSQQTLDLALNILSFSRPNLDDDIYMGVNYLKVDGTTTTTVNVYLPTEVLQTNLATNPSAKTATGYSVFSGTGGTATGSVISGSTPAGTLTYYRATWTAPSTGGSPGITYTESISGITGDINSASMWMYSYETRNVQLLFRYRMGTTVVTESRSPVIECTNAWTEIKCENVVAEGSYDNILLWMLPVAPGVTFLAGQNMSVCGVLIEKRSSLTGKYYDGDTPNTALSTYAWTGTANASRSTRTIQKVTTGLNTMKNAIVTPNGAYLARLTITTRGKGSSFTFNNASITLTNTNSPAGVAKLTDGYLNLSAKELIQCSVLTKAFDYQATSVFKRLFLWGADVVTPREIELKVIPLGAKKSVTWDEAAAYTWDQLSQGSWDSPLSWKGQSSTVVDTSGPFADTSENGRFFVKSPKSLRFRQIQFSVKMTTLGNLETGPAKLFTMTTFTKAGQLVVDKAT